MMTPSYSRDLIGYGPNPPDPQWPNGARLAVNFVLNYEEGSEPSFADGDGQSETGLTESAGQSQGVRGRDLAAESMFEYGSRVGFWRIVRLFQERQLPLTVFGCALALERHPLAARTIAESGYDVCCHGWRWVQYYNMRGSRGAGAYPQSGCLVANHGRHAAARMVLPLWAKREYPTAHRGRRRVPVRFRCL